MSGHPIWFCLTWACVIWYSIMTLYVGFRGIFDIQSMLKNLAAINEEDKKSQ